MKILMRMMKIHNAAAERHDEDHESLSLRSLRWMRRPVIVPCDSACRQVKGRE